MVRVLCIEDEVASRKEVELIAGECGTAVDLQFVDCAAAAEAALGLQFYDFVVLDLRIPIASGSLEVDAKHGMAVLAKARELCPGTPILVFTGSPAEEANEHFRAILQSGAQQADVWYCGAQIPTIDYLRKSKLPDFAEQFGVIAAAVAGLADIENRGTPINVSEQDDKLLRILVRHREGASFQAEKVGIGLSGADVFKVSLSDERGVGRGSFFLKISGHETIKTEVGNNDRHVSRLEGGATPRLVGAYLWGGGDRAAVAYSIAPGDRTAFELAADPSCNDMLEALWSFLHPLQEGVKEGPSNVEAIICGDISQEQMAALIDEYKLNDLAAILPRKVQCRECVTHGDLHGFNILVDDQNRPTVIDLGDFGERPAPFDWLTLELSLIFHMQAPARDTEWPTIEQCKSWGDIDKYTEGCPFADFVGKCRELSTRSEAGPRETAACAIAYLVRQLRYEDTDKARALALLEGIVRTFP